MDATDRLRALLDERGARWTACSKATIDNQTYCYGHTYTEFQAGLMVTDLTPEQAVEATLGPEDCWNTWDSELTGRLRFQCSECKAVSLEITPFYCPVCGRKVVK